MPGAAPALLAALTTADLVVVVIPVTVALLAVIVLAGLYNGLAVARVRMRNALSQIDVQLRRRHDLIPGLVETVRGYMEHERATLQAVIQARAEAVQASDGLRGGGGAAVRALVAASASLDGALRALLARVEAYPDLKANAVMQNLQEELVSTENRVAFARQAFNDAVMRLNERVATFPGNLVASLFGFEAAEPWRTEEPTRAVPAVRVGQTP
jgi:LemA protein